MLYTLPNILIILQISYTSIRKRYYSNFQWKHWHFLMQTPAFFKRQVCEDHLKSQVKNKISPCRDESLSIPFALYRETINWFFFSFFVTFHLVLIWDFHALLSISLYILCTVWLMMLVWGWHLGSGERVYSALCHSDSNSVRQ